MPHRQSPRGRCLAALAATLLLSTCGLPDVPLPTLPPPEDPLAEDIPDRFSFNRPRELVRPLPSHSEADKRRYQRLIEAFRGYVVFYRLFDDESVRTNLRPSQLCHPNFFLLRSKDERGGTGSECPPLGTVSPLISDPKGDVERVDIHFAAVNAPVAILHPANKEEISLWLRRGVLRRASGKFANFTDCQDGDPDLTEIEQHCPGGEERIQIQLYVMSYGETESGGPLWSDEALFLDSITLP